MKYPVADNELERLATLKNLQILDTEAESSFDALTEIARLHFSMPIVTISLVDEERQWFKSHSGLGVCETDRDVAFCNYTILSNEIYEVTDASEHPTFKENPLVISGPNIRYYCGAPIIVNGAIVGAFCLIDSLPHQSMTADDRALLSRLAYLASHLMISCRLLNEGAVSYELQESRRLKSLGVLVAGLAHEINNPLGIALTASTHANHSVADLRKNIAHLESTDLADFLEDQETAFQLIADNLKRASNLVVGFKDIASDRVLDDLKEINLRDYVRSIEQSLTPVLKNAHCKLSLDIDPTIFMQVNTGSLSQLITNLVLNATIHAFSGVKDCQIQIAGKQDSQHIFLKISDNGNGIPAHVLPNLFTPFYTTKRADGGTGLGLYVSRQIATDILMGRLSVQNLPDKGCEFTLEIPRH